MCLILEVLQYTSYTVEWRLFLLYFTDAYMVGSGYYLATYCISNVDSETAQELAAIVDNNITTCAKCSAGLDDVEMSLQATFIFRDYITNDKTLSTEVVLKESVGCSSLVWTWFAQSNNTADRFVECSKSQLFSYLHFTHCLVTCSCKTPCASLHVMFNPVPFIEMGQQLLCEVLLRPGSIAPRVI